MKLILITLSLFSSAHALAQTPTPAQSLTIRQNVVANSRSNQQTPTLLLAYNQIQAQASAIYTAGQSVTLQPGFEALVGSVFEATIGLVSFATSEPTGILQARLLGNPVIGSQAEVQITGVAGQAVTLQLVDEQGRPVHGQRIEQVGETERVSLPLGSSRGTLLLKVNTDSQQQSLKLLRP